VPQEKLELTAERRTVLDHRATQIASVDTHEQKSHHLVQKTPIKKKQTIHILILTNVFLRKLFYLKKF